MKLEEAVISVVGVLYFAVGAVYLFKRQYAWSLMWFAYSMANAGYILGTRAK